MSCGIVDDIEDILKNDSQLLNDDLSRSGNKPYVLPKSVIKKSNELENNNSELNSFNNDNSSNIPGLATIWVKTWGCTHNTSDSEYMAGQLAAYGYKIVDEPNDANLWLLNSCTVKNPAEDHFKNYIDKAKAENKYLVLAGCVPQGAPKAQYIQGCSIIGVQQIDRIVEVVEQTLNGNSVRLFGKKKKDNKKYGGASLNLPKVRRNPLIEIIAINTGCLNECTYCKTKHARGELGSYDVEEIVERVKQSFEEGVVEIWLTSEDTGAYGKDIGTSIVELLWKIVEHIPEGCFLRIGMTNPPYILEYLEQMALILDHPRVYSFLHIPIQSGSDAVLQDMKREYSSDDFRHIVDYLKNKIPNINILTDIICGFPTETEHDFEQTLDIIRQYMFSSLFINQFFQRPGTPAARMRQIPTQERKRRTKLVSELFNSYTSYDHKLGNKFSVLVTEISHDEKYYVGHNKYYEQVLVPKLEAIIGKLVQVEIIECTKFSMIGKIVDDLDKFQNQVAIKYRKGEITGLINNKTNLKQQDQNNNDCCSGGSCGDSSSSSCCSNEIVVENLLKDQSYFNEKLRHYALVTLSAFSIVLVSKLLLRAFE